MENTFKDIAIVVIGYDPYKDVWDHYFCLLNKYWPDRPQTYLVTNAITPKYDNVTVIPAGHDAEWSKKVQMAINNIDKKYFILLLEDFFATRPIDNNTVVELLNIISFNDIKYCKLLNQSKIKGLHFKENKNLHVIARDEEYGISLQPAIWNTQFLSQILGRDNYNAWIFEFNQVREKNWNKDRIDSIADDRNVLQITHSIVQSKYLPSAIRKFRSQKYFIDTSDRPALSFLENFKYRTKCIVSEYSPQWSKKILKSIGRILGVDFVSDRQLS